MMKIYNVECERNRLKAIFFYLIALLMFEDMTSWQLWKSNVTLDNYIVIFYVCAVRISVNIFFSKPNWIFIIFPIYTYFSIDVASLK